MNVGTNYYVRLPGCEKACEHCAEAGRVHIGKSSGGWRFLHRAYRHEDFLPAGLGFPVTDHASWLKLLGLGGIIDEYDREQDKDELLAFIDLKQDGIARGGEKARELSGPYYFLADGEFTFTSDGYDFLDREFS